MPDQTFQACMVIVLAASLLSLWQALLIWFERGTLILRVCDYRVRAWQMSHSVCALERGGTRRANSSIIVISWHVLFNASIVCIV